MNVGALDHLYKEFGKLVRLHRGGIKGMTQEKLGRFVGLSRTSITNIEKGRQHVSLHHIFAIAAALRIRPSALMPSMGDTSSDESWMAKKLPPGTEPEITEWAEKLVGKHGEPETL